MLLLELRFDLSALFLDVVVLDFESESSLDEVVGVGGKERASFGAC